jgi:hypothetical protein
MTIAQAFKPEIPKNNKKLEPTLAGDRIIQLALANNQVCDVGALQRQGRFDPIGLHKEL